MIVRVDKSFEKDTQKIKDKKVLKKLADLIQKLQEIQGLEEIQHLKKLKGYESYYRIRLGAYRIGISSEEDKIDLIRFLHRKDIYRFFP